MQVCEVSNKKPTVISIIGAYSARLAHLKLLLKTIPITSIHSNDILSLVC